MSLLDDLKLKAIQALESNFEAPIVYVSEMPYTEQYSYRPAARDRSIDNNPIKIGGRAYAKGIGAHANSTITIDLKGGYAKFSSLIGFDDEVLPTGASQANAIYKVRLDGAEVYNSAPMAPGMTKLVELNVAGGHSLELITDSNGTDACDHTDWGGAALKSARAGLGIGALPLTEKYDQYPLRLNRSIDNNPISLGGHVFAKGIGSHTKSEITVPLGCKFAAFKSFVGIDDEVLGRPDEGSAVFKVFLDGVEAYSSGTMTPGMIKPVNVRLLGKQRMKLATYPVSSYMNGHTDWANAIVERSLVTTQHIDLQHYGGIDVVPALEITGEDEYNGKIEVKIIAADMAERQFPYITGEAFVFQGEEGLSFEEGKLTLAISGSLLIDNPINKLWMACLHNDTGYVERLETTIGARNSLSAKMSSLNTYFVVNAEKYDICKTNMGRYGLLSNF